MPLEPLWTTEDTDDVDANLGDISPLEEKVSEDVWTVLLEIRARLQAQRNRHTS